MFVYRRMYIITFVSYVASCLAVMMSNIIQSAQVIDMFFAHYASKSYGLQLSPKLEFVYGDDVTSVTPFDSTYIISLGFCIVAIMSIPFSLLDVTDNIALQWIATCGLAVFTVIWVAAFFNMDSFDYHNVPVFSLRLEHILGVVLFNYAFVGMSLVCL